MSFAFSAHNPALTFEEREQLQLDQGWLSRARIRSVRGGRTPAVIGRGMVDMICLRIDIRRRKLVRYIHRELSLSAIERIEHHLPDCSRCRGRLSQLRTGDKFANYVPMMTVQRDPWRSIEAAISRPLTSTHGRSARAFADQFKRPVLSIFVIALVITATIAVVLLTGNTSNRDSFRALKLDPA